jgi:DNA-binding IclR family transcriptional regulator
MPMARGAISRAIMAWLPRRQLVPMIEERMADFIALGLGSTVPEVLETMKSVRRTGYAVAKGEVTPGVVGIAAPIFDGGTAPVAALCVTTAAGHMMPDHIAELGQNIAARAAQLSSRLAPGPDPKAERPQPADEE